MSNIESTVCLFSASKADCKSPRRTNLTMVACKNHLKEYYGLEMGYHLDDHPTNVAWVGGFLRPVKNFSYFKRNTVIFPTKEFFDRTQRPEEYDNANANVRKYQMNPIILDYIRKYGMNAGKNVDYRLVIEMYRNLMDTKVDPGPNQKTQLQNLITLIRSKISISVSNITDQAIYNVLPHCSVYVNNELKSLKDLNISKIMQYILFNCLFSEAKITFEEDNFPDYLPYNCEFIPNIGLVATELINHPHFLVINGLSVGSQVFYNAFVSLVQKEVLHKNYTLKDIPPQYALTYALKSGSVC